MKLKFSGFIILPCVLICCASPGAKQAKIYQGKLETMLGEETKHVVVVVKDWKYEVLEQWETENPSVDEVKKHDRSVCGFSKKEVQEIFSQDGNYKCMLFLKKIEAAIGSVGKIDMTGMTDLKDTGVMAEQFSLIRVVFRDGRLIHFKVWPCLSQASMTRRKTMG